MAADDDEATTTTTTGAARPPRRTEGATPNGGAYAIAYYRDDGSKEIVEFDANDVAIFRTYMQAPSRPPAP